MWEVDEAPLAILFLYSVAMESVKGWSDNPVPHLIAKPHPSPQIEGLVI